MKQLTIYFIAVFLFMTTSASFAQKEWTQLNFTFNSSTGFVEASPDDKIFSYVKYFNDSYEAMLSLDGGNTWSQVHDDRFDAAIFNSANQLFAIRQKRVQGVSTFYPHKIFFTADDGNNWTTTDTAAANPGEVATSIFRRDNRGTLYTGKRIVSDYVGGFKYSIDNGDSWTMVPTFIESQYDYRTPHSALLTSQGDLFITTYNSGIYRSQDGGTNWEKVYSSFVTLAHLHEHPQTGDLYAASISAILKSTDNGNTWEILEPNPSFAMNIGEFELSSNGIFYIAGMWGVHQSNDAINWELIWDSNQKNSRSAVRNFSLSDNYIYVSASDSSIYRSQRDGGSSAINEKKQDRHFTLYPNPAASEVSIRLLETISGAFTVSIIDLCGMRLRTLDFAAGVSNPKIELADIPCGVYLLSIDSDSYSSRQKLIVKK